MQRFIMYARKSTDEKDRQILSLESQINELRELARREHLEVVAEYTEAKTAKAPGRPIFSHILQQIEKYHADGIVAWHPDRLARNSIDGGKIIYLIDTGKIADLRFPTYRFDNTAQGKFMLSIAFSQSKYYVDNLSENVKRGIREKLRRGEWPGWAPLGYLNDYKNHVILLDPEKAPFIRRLFELFGNGMYTIIELYREAMKWGLTGKKGKPLPKSSLENILRNPFYYGVMRLNNELYEGSHPPIISKTLFDLVQQALEQKAKPVIRGAFLFPFTGLMKCGECGASITAERQKGHTYYRCTKKLGRCSQRYLREEELVSQIDKALLRIHINRDAMGNMLNKLDETSAEEQNVSSHQSHQQLIKIKEYDVRTGRLIDLFLAGEITQAEYHDKKAQIINQKKEIQEIITGIEKRSSEWLEPSKNFIITCNQAGSIAQDRNLTKKRDFLRILGSNFTLTDGSLSFAIRKPHDVAVTGLPF